MPTRRHAALLAAILAMTAHQAMAEPRIDAAAATLPDPARAALDRIPDQGDKLLATRSYLRSARTLESRWSWSKAQIEAYAKTDHYATAMAAVAAVSKAFEVKNPGYSLRVNTDVRSLDEQIDKWNANGSVEAAGNDLDAAATKWLADNPEAKPEQFRAFLTDWKGATPTLAAPGLSQHGRGLAFDFQVMDDGKAVAAADSGAIASAWRGATPGPGGWDARLREAVRLSTMPFDGPLQNPDEPWHYDYKPKGGAPDLVAEAPAPVAPWPRPVAAAPKPAAPPDGQELAMAAKEADPDRLEQPAPKGVTEKIDAEPIAETAPARPAEPDAEQLAMAARAADPARLDQPAPPGATGKVDAEPLSQSEAPGVEPGAEHLAMAARAVDPERLDQPAPDGVTAKVDDAAAQPAEAKPAAPASKPAKASTARKKAPTAAKAKKPSRKASTTRRKKSTTPSIVRKIFGT